MYLVTGYVGMSEFLRTCSRQALYTNMHVFNTYIERYLTHMLSATFFTLLTHEGSHREVYQELQPSYDIFRRWCQALFRPQVLCIPQPTLPNC